MHYDIGDLMVSRFNNRIKVAGVKYFRPTYLTRRVRPLTNTNIYISIDVNFEQIQNNILTVKVDTLRWIKMQQESWYTASPDVKQLIVSKSDPQTSRKLCQFGDQEKGICRDRLPVEQKCRICFGQGNAGN
jgi:hypothetical protein